MWYTFLYIRQRFQETGQTASDKKKPMGLMYDAFEINKRILKLSFKYLILLILEDFILGNLCMF